MHYQTHKQEHLLFYLESSQWLLSFDCLELKKDEEQKEAWCGNIIFPPNAPKSRIVSAAQRMTDVWPALGGASKSVKVDANGMIVRKSKFIKYKDFADARVSGSNLEQIQIEMKDAPSTPDTIQDQKSISICGHDYDHHFMYRAFEYLENM